jgi:hypothetical protein
MALLICFSLKNDFLYKTFVTTPLEKSELEPRRSAFVTSIEVPIYSLRPYLIKYSCRISLGQIFSNLSKFGENINNISISK